MKKIVIIGCPGSGKSTFAKLLSDLTSLPLFHLDMLYWNKDKTIVDKQVFLNNLNDILNLDEWIIDGNYLSTMELRISKCDTIIFLDYPLEICLDGIKNRIGKPRSDMPWLEKDVDSDFVKYVERYNIDIKPQVFNILRKYAYKDTYIFKNRSDLSNFLDLLSR